MRESVKNMANLAMIKTVRTFLKEENKSKMPEQGWVSSVFCDHLSDLCDECSAEERRGLGELEEDWQSEMWNEIGGYRTFGLIREGSLNLK